MRIQNNIMAMNAYRNYSNNTSALSKNLEKLSSGYKINRAFKIHSSLNATQAQYNNNKTVTSKFETAWSTIEGILDDLTNKLGSVPALEGLNGTNLDDLDTQAQVLRAGAEAIVQSMNGKYGQDYIFAGSDNQNAPFAIKDGHVTYRGIAVDDATSLNEIYHDPKTGEPMLDSVERK